MRRASARVESASSDAAARVGLVLGEPVVERLQADAEHLGAAPLVALALVERRVDRLALDFRERRADRNAQAVAVRRRARQGSPKSSSTSSSARMNARWTAFLSSRTLPGQRYARMVAIACAREALRVPSSSFSSAQEVLGQQLGVAVALAQRRQRDREHREPIHQVLAQLAVADRLLRIAVGRGDDARVACASSSSPPTRVIAAGLQHAQQAHLHLRRHLGDLVEEQRAALGALEAAAVLRAAPVNAPFS